VDAAMKRVISNVSRFDAHRLLSEKEQKKHIPQS